MSALPSVWRELHGTEAEQELRRVRRTGGIFASVTAEIIILGGAEDIGANSTYIGLDGTGIIVDAGLHPRDRGQLALPALDMLGHRSADVLVISHAHNDHIGGLPYVMRRMPHLRPLMTHATRDLSHVMLHNTGKLLKSDVTAWFPAESLAYYTRDQIELLRHAFEAIDYDVPQTIRGWNGRSDVQLTLHWAGHILGSASVALECGGLSILHTTDIQFDHQALLSKTRVPRRHVDVMITEATNCAVGVPNDHAGEAKRLAAFITSVTNENGSVLIPSFALGKTQETLRTLYGLMRRGSIPHLPIYTGGMGVRINKIYDQYCYTEPFREPGFEVSDIPQERIKFDELFNDDYLKDPAIVVAQSGMLNKGTLSHALARVWMTKPSFGIAFIGYQDPDTPGYQLSQSKPGVPFPFGTREMTRSCKVERFRFSAHASKDGLVDFITDVRPGTLCITHGAPEACDALALAVRERLPGTRIIIPTLGRPYTVGRAADVQAASTSMGDHE